MFPTFRLPEFEPKFLSSQTKKNHDKIAEIRECRGGKDSYDSDLILSLGTQPRTVNKRAIDSDFKPSEGDQTLRQDNKQITVCDTRRTETEPTRIFWDGGLDGGLREPEQDNSFP